MKRNTIIFVFVMSFFVNCFGDNMNNRYIPAPYVVMADKIIANVAAKMRERYKKYKLRVIGEGGGMIDTVNMVGLSFQIAGPVSKDELRAMFVDSVEMFLKDLNANEEIRPFLKTYPFTIEGIDNTIFVVDKNGGKLFYPDISVVTNVKNIIDYRTNDKENEYRHKTEESESYEEALKIVKQGKKS